MRDLLRSFQTGLTVACRLGGRPKAWEAPPARFAVGPTGGPLGTLKHGPQAKLGGTIASSSVSGGSTHASAVLRKPLNPPNGSSGLWGGGSSTVNARAYAQDLAASELRTTNPGASSTSAGASASATASAGTRFMVSLGQSARQHVEQSVGGAISQNVAQGGALSAARVTPSRLPSLCTYWGAIPTGVAGRASFAAPRVSSALGAATWLPGSTLLLRITRSVLHFLGTGAAILAASQATGAHTVVHAR